jgi:hypothetical protein
MIDEQHSAATFAKTGERGREQRAVTEELEAVQARDPERLVGKGEGWLSTRRREVERIPDRVRSRVDDRAAREIGRRPSTGGVEIPRDA